MEEPNTDKPNVTAYHCCVPYCTYDSRYDDERAHSINKFPKDSTREKILWIIKIRRDFGCKFNTCIHVDCSIQTNEVCGELTNRTQKDWYLPEDFIDEKH